MASNYGTLEHRWSVNSSQPTSISRKNTVRMWAEWSRMNCEDEVDCHDPCASRWLGHEGLDTERRASGEWTSGYTGREGDLPTSRLDANEDEMITRCDHLGTFVDTDEIPSSDEDYEEDVFDRYDPARHILTQRGNQWHLVNRIEVVEDNKDVDEQDEDLGYDDGTKSFCGMRAELASGEWRIHERDDEGWKRQTHVRHQHERHPGRALERDQVAPATRVIEDDLNHLAFCEVHERFNPEPATVENDDQLEPLESWEASKERYYEDEAYYGYLYERETELLRRIAEFEDEGHSEAMAEMNAIADRWADFDPFDMLGDPKDIVPGVVLNRFHVTYQDVEEMLEREELELAQFNAEIEREAHRREHSEAA